MSATWLRPFNDDVMRKTLLTNATKEHVSPDHHGKCELFEPMNNAERAVTIQEPKQNFKCRINY